MYKKKNTHPNPRPKVHLSQAYVPNQLQFSAEVFSRLPARDPAAKMPKIAKHAKEKFMEPEHIHLLTGNIFQLLQKWKYKLTITKPETQA